MRLGQMARKLGVTQGEIVRYLTGKNVRVDEGSNVKLDELQIRLLYAHFAPGERFETQPVVETPRLETSKPAPFTTLETSAGTPVAGSPPDLQQRESARAASDAQSLPPDSSEEVADVKTPDPVKPIEEVSIIPSETIRATKVELAGLKVIGKIELPEPKKKTAPGGDANAEQPTGEGEVLGTEQTSEGAAGKNLEGTKGSEQPRRKIEGRRAGDERGSRRRQREQRPANPIAAQREREQQQELERRKEKAAQDKERRTQNYNSRVKQSPPTKAIRPIQEPMEQFSDVPVETEPSTWIGKLFKWLGF